MIHKEVITVSGLYSIPNALLAQQVGMVLNVDSYKKWDKKRERPKDQGAAKERSPFQQILEKEKEKAPEHVGSFFEARA